MSTLRALLSYREYILFASMLALKNQYKQNHLGLAWLLIDPILKMMVYYFVFVFVIQRFTSDFVSFLLIGILTWTWANKSISSVGKSIFKASKISQVHVPKIVFPSISFIKGIVEFVFVFVFLLLVQSTRGDVYVSWLSLPIILLSFTMVVWGVSIIVAALMPLIPDLDNVMKPVLSGMFFCSGIFYEVTPADAHYDIFMMNPVAKTLEQLRAVILKGQWPELNFLMVNIMIGIVLTFIGILLVRKFEYIYPRKV